MPPLLSCQPTGIGSCDDTNCMLLLLLPFGE
jgi:hypothetical protein